MPGVVLLLLIQSPLSEEDGCSLVLRNVSTPTACSGPGSDVSVALEELNSGPWI